MSEKCYLPLVSILINNYNYGRFLSEAIESALNQTYPNIEVIIVDDGSTDNSREVIKAYGDRIKSILKENGGQASTFNAGFTASNGQIICFLDSDDQFISTKIMSVVDAFQKHPEIGWYFHELQFFGENIEQSHPEKTPDYSGIYDLQPCMENGKLRGCLPFEVDTATSGISFSRSLLEKILPMPEVIRITSDDYVKYAALGSSTGFISFQSLALQRIHGNNAYTARSNVGYLKAKIQFLTANSLRKNFPKLSKFSNNLVAMGISISWWLKGVEDELQELLKDYLSTTTLRETIEIYIKAGYYRFVRHYLNNIGFIR